MILLRALARLVTFLLLLALSITGLAVAIFSIRGDDRPLSLPALADNVRLPQLRDTVGDFFAQLEAPGNVALLSLLAGAAAVLLGVLLLVGALSSRKERLVVLERNEAGTLAARRRPLGQVAAALAEQARGVVTTSVKVRTRRRGRGGRVEVTALHPRDASPDEVRSAAGESLASLTGPFGLRSRIRPQLGERGARVQ